MLTETEEEVEVEAASGAAAVDDRPPKRPRTDGMTVVAVEDVSNESTEPEPPLPLADMTDDNPATAPPNIASVATTSDSGVEQPPTVADTLRTKPDEPADHPFPPVDWIDVKSRVKFHPIRQSDHLDDVCFRLRRVGYVSVFNVVAEDRLTPRPTIDAVLTLQERLVARSAAVRNDVYRRRSEFNFQWQQTYDRDQPLRDAVYRAGQLLVGGKNVEFWRSEEKATALIREALHLTVINEWTKVNAPCLALCVDRSAVLSPFGDSGERRALDVLAPLRPDFYDVRLGNLRPTAPPETSTRRWEIRPHWRPIGVASPDGEFEIVVSDELRCCVVRSKNDADPNAPVLSVGRRNLPRSAAVYAKLMQALTHALNWHVDAEKVFTDLDHRSART